MNNIRKSLEILFKNQNPEELIDKFFNPFISKRITEEIDSNVFQCLFSFQNKNLYNKNEIENITELIENNWSKNLYIEKKDFFNVLVSFSENILLEKNGEPLCNYENLLRWRELSYQLGEDLFTTSYFAYKDYKLGKERSKFAWKPIISTNNTRIKELLKKGLAENHFHLKGSGSHFQLSWLSLMNNIGIANKKFEVLYKQKRLSPEININFEAYKQDFKVLIQKAAAIRYYLTQKYILEENIEKLEKDWELVKKILKSREDLEIQLYKNKLQNEIDILKFLNGKNFGGEVPDYMIPKNITENNYNKDFEHYNGNILLYGERKFLYTLFKKIYSGNSDLNFEKDLLYIYIIIKQKFRAEIIQNNRIVGFGNFENYQNRKSIFLSSELYNKAVINMAINGSMYNQKIKSLEARIAPENTPIDYNKTIKYYDRCTKNNEFYDIKKDSFEDFFNIQNKEENFFYNIHFIKIPENISLNSANKYFLELFPRNYKLRKNIKKQALELNKFRKSGYDSAKRILGIDAANTEIGCRPEVFGQIFRYLKNYSYENPLNVFGIDNFQELGISYHVGEEFLDLVDGLRAIDETIRFLNLSYGDRLGHALALGILPENYYQSKEYIIVASKQVILDNIVWLLAKIREYNINVSSTFINNLENEYRRLFYDIYEKNFEVGNNPNNEKEYYSSMYGITHYDYYESWKLRGDNPELYQNIEKENLEENILSFFERCGLNNYLDTNLARKNKKARVLYKYYHYNYKVKLDGAEVIEFKITSEYIDIVKKIQLKLQGEISKKNIFIETNPSSNYLIGTINNYIEHPILNFYNLGLGKAEASHQISVSINTDDQGIFSTYLENEYALMALALEKCKDENGEYMYNQTMIYEWLDKIRQMGLEQSFKNKNNH